MKLQQYIKLSVFLFIIVGLTLSSCKKLDTLPTTEYTPGNFWKEKKQASAALNGAYVLLQTALNTEFIYYGEARADNLKLARENNTASINVANNTLDVNMDFADWSRFYQVVRQANLIIRNLSLMKGEGIFTASATDVAEYSRIMGQAYGLRALSYFYMVRVWGGVPLEIDPVDDNDISAYKTPRVDSLVIFNQISTDLTRARALLPTSYADNRQNRAMLTQGAIDAMFTDYYMWRNNVDSAIITSERFINTSGIITNTNYKLVTLADPAINYFSNRALIDNSPYAKMFIDGFSDESIFEIAFSADENTVSNIYGVFGSTSSQFIISSQLSGKFNPFDLRSVAAVLPTSQTTISKYFPKTGYDPASTNDQNVIVYRLADILLLRAEALNIKNNRAGAWAILKLIRERAFGATGTTNNNALTGPTGSTEEANFLALSTTAAEDFILNERARELCFEGKRWFDLVRTKRAISVMQPINGLTNPENIWWPIKLSIIRQNQEIIQNIYYR